MSAGGNGFTLGRRLCLEFLNNVNTAQFFFKGCGQWKEEIGVVMGSYDQLRIGRQKSKRR